MNTVQICLLGMVGLLTFVLLTSYFKNAIAIRNESEYRDIVEHQVMLMSALIKQNPELIKRIENIRYFRDHSGFFIVLDTTGKIVAHGDRESTEESTLNLPINDILNIAKEGNGYIKYNHRGHIHELFVYICPGSKYIVCSGLFIDNHHVNRRLLNWKRVDRTILKKSNSSGKKRIKSIETD
jgi:hypothetical protein